MTNMTNRSDQIKNMYVCMYVCMYVSSSSSVKCPIHSQQSLMGGSTHEQVQGGAKKQMLPHKLRKMPKTATAKGPALPGRIPR